MQFGCDKGAKLLKQSLCFDAYSGFLNILNEAPVCVVNLQTQTRVCTFAISRHQLMLNKHVYACYALC